jgi:hypothetical protein
VSLPSKCHRNAIGRLLDGTIACYIKPSNPSFGGRRTATATATINNNNEDDEEDGET